MPQLVSSLAGVLDVRKFLEIENEDWNHRVTCVGYAPSQRRRCRVHIAVRNQDRAQHLLNKLSQCHRKDQLEEYLLEIAEASLCTRWHKDQTQSIARQWMRSLRPYISQVEDPERKPRKEKRLKQAPVITTTNDRRDEPSKPSLVPIPCGQLVETENTFQPELKVECRPEPSVKAPDANDVIISVNHSSEQQRACEPEKRSNIGGTAHQKLTNSGPSSSCQRPSQSSCCHVDSGPRLTVRLGQYGSIQCSLDRNLPGVIEISSVNNVMSTRATEVSAVQHASLEERTKTVQEANDAPHTNRQPLQVVNDSESGEESLSIASASSGRAFRPIEDQRKPAFEDGSGTGTETPEEAHTVDAVEHFEKTEAEDKAAEETELAKTDVEEVEAEKIEVEETETETTQIEETEDKALSSNGKEGEDCTLVRPGGQEEQKEQEGGDDVQEKAQVEEIAEESCEATDKQALQDDAQDEHCSTTTIPNSVLTRVALYAAVQVAAVMLSTLS